MINQTRCRLWREQNMTMPWTIIQTRSMSNWIRRNLWWKPDKTTTWLIYRFGLRQNRNWIFGTYLIRCAWWWKLDRTTMWPIIQVHFTLKMILKCHDWLNRLLSVTKARHDNEVTDHTGAIYVENNTKLSWAIRLGADCDENQVGQLCD